MVAACDFTANPGMLSLEKISIRSAAYYVELAHEHYYLQGGEPPGQWHGGGAKALGLSGQVAGETFHRLFQGFSPDGTRPLVQNAGKNDGYHRRVPGWDLTFSPPKSVSVCWALAPEPMRKEIERVHDEAVRKTLAIVEQHAGITRSGSGGWKRETAALCFALFQHGTSRAQDPQLHTHAVCFNLGLRSNDGWGALKTDQLFELKTAFGTLYRCQLAHLLQKELSYPVEKNGAFFEIKGVDRDIIEFFSTRRAEIIDYCRTHGGYDAMLAEQAALVTRPEKSHVAREVLFAAWTNAAAELGWSSGKVVGLQTWQAEKTNWTAEMKALSADIEAALRASPVKPSKAETLQTVAESMQTSGLSAHQVLAATYEALGRSKTRLSPSNQKQSPPFADRLTEAQAAARTGKESKNQEEFQKRSEEFRKKWAEAATRHKAERESREKEERAREKRLSPRHQPVSARVSRKRRSEFAVVRIGRLKNRRYPFTTLELRVFNVDVQANRPFQRSPWWSPFHYVKLPAVAVDSDFAPHKLRRRLTIPLRDAKHAALRQIREAMVTAFKTGARLVWIRDERLEQLERSINEGRRFLRQFRKPRVLVGKSDGHAWRGILDDWERAGGMTRPEGNLILCQTRAAAERLNAEIQKERCNQGRVGLRSIQVNEETLHLHDRVTFRTSNTRTDLKNLDQVNIGDFGTVTKVAGDRITIRTDAGVKVEFQAKEAPDVRLAYAAAHADAASANPRKAFILFEGKGPELEFEAIKARAADCQVRVYTGPDLAQCFTVEGQRELNHRRGLQEMDAHDAKRNEAWKQEASDQKVKPDSKSQGRSEESSQGGLEAETRAAQASGTKRAAPSYWNPSDRPKARLFEEERTKGEEQNRAERAIERQNADEDRKRAAEVRKAKRAAKPAAVNSESGVPEQPAPAKIIVSRSPFHRVSDTETRWTGQGVRGRSPFEAERDQRESQDPAERATEQRLGEQEHKQAAEERKARWTAKQAQQGSQPPAAVAKTILSRSPFGPVSDTKSYWTGEGVARRSPFTKERTEEDLRNQAHAATAQSEEAKRLHDAALATKDRSAAHDDKTGSPGGDPRIAERDRPSDRTPTVPATETKSYWTGKGRVGASPFTEERLEDDEERRREEERRRREEEEMRRQATKAPAQSSQAQSNSHSHSHSHSH